MNDRRRAPRAEAELNINVDAQASHCWQGKTINLSTIGVKVALPPTAIRPPWGTRVQLRLSGPNGQLPISASPLTCPNTRRFTTEDVQQLLGPGLPGIPGFGFKRVQPFSADGPGDTTVVAKYQYFRNED